MPARLLDGRAMGAELRAELKREAERRTRELGRPVGLAILRVGADPASVVYANRLVQIAQDMGVMVREDALPLACDNAQLRERIEQWNRERAVDGILVQLPLPAHLSARTVAEAIDPLKDVDGSSLGSSGNLFLRLPTFVPSTCAAVLELLDRGGISLAGKHIVIVGASNVVGKPLAFMLLQRDATVTVCHIATRDLATWTRQAEVLIVAAGRPNLILGDMVRAGATVIDVGINVGADGQIVGDVDQASVAQVAGALSPVPGGVGPLTNLMLLKQCVLGPQLVSGAGSE